MFERHINLFKIDDICLLVNKFTPKYSQIMFISLTFGIQKLLNTYELCQLQVRTRKSLTYQFNYTVIVLVLILLI